MRRQVTETGTARGASPPPSRGSELSPDTFQMLPSQVLTMAAFPPSVKSNPVSRIRQNQGLSVGRSSTSTVKGPLSVPIKTGP